eukprot:GAHX01002302.1.p1 GENE.GAHX01002302.1~~GAHX01002302.1.p1  ORF type:complete len:394 (-),score=91.07 GAHX01002302.1:44-1225(-)
MSQKIFTRTIKLFILISLQLNILLTSNTPLTPDEKEDVNKLNVVVNDNTRLFTQKIANTSEEGIKYYLLYITERNKSIFNVLSYIYKAMVILKVLEVKGEEPYTHEILNELMASTGEKTKDNLTLYLKNQKVSLTVMKAALFSKTFGLHGNYHNNKFLIEFTKNKNKSNEFFRLVIENTKTDENNAPVNLLRMQTEMRIKTSFEKVITNDKVVNELKKYLEENSDNDYEEIRNELFESYDIKKDELKAKQLRPVDGSMVKNLSFMKNYKTDKDSQFGENKLSFDVFNTNQNYNAGFDPIKPIKDETDPDKVVDSMKEGFETMANFGESLGGLVSDIEDDIENKVENLEVKLKNNNEVKKKKVLMIIGIVACSLLMVTVLVAVIVKVRSNQLKK